MFPAGASQQMIEQDFVGATDFTQISLKSLPGLVRRLNQETESKEEVDLHHLDAVSKWVLSGWRFICDHQDELHQDLVCSADPKNSIVDLAASWARFTRDLAGSSQQYQEALRPTINCIIKILWITSAVVKLDHEDFQSFNRFSIQALSNLITLNPTSAQHTWPLLADCEEQKSILLRLLYTQNHALLLTIAVLILNTVHGEPETTESLINSPVGKKAMTMLLERLDKLLDDEKEVVFEVIVNLVRAVVNVEPIAQVPKLYYSQATPSQVLSPAQLSILKILESSDLPPFSYSFLLEEFKKLSCCLDQSWQGFVLITEILCKSIEMIHEISSDEDEAISDDEAGKVVEISITILKGLEQEKNQINGSDQTRQEKMRSINQILIALIKLLTCLLELKKLNCKFLQDLIRTLNGFPIILSFTKFDVDFPYLREHSIFLIKYLLKDNLENQAIIKNLQPIS